MAEQREIFNCIKHKSIDKEITCIPNLPLETKSDPIVIQSDIIQNAIRCQLKGCNKKLSLTEMLCKCQCGNTHCTTHRLSSDHMCTYDYKKNNNHNQYKVVSNKFNKI